MKQSLDSHQVLATIPLGRFDPLSFAKVVSEATESLRRSPFAELHEVVVVCDEHKIHLCGEVESFFMKQIAQETVRAATEGYVVDNDLYVLPPRKIH
jgi:hypothetical protein